MSTIGTHPTGISGISGTNWSQFPYAETPVRLDKDGNEIKEKAETRAQTTTTTATVSAPAIQKAAHASQAAAQAPAAKSYFWKVIDAICSPFKWIANVVKVFFKEILDDDNNGSILPNQKLYAPPAILTPEQRNANELASNKAQLAQWTTQVEALENQAKSAKALIEARDFSTPKKFLEWMQVCTAHSFENSPILQPLMDKRDSLESDIKTLNGRISDKPGTPPIPDFAILKAHCTALQAQNTEHEQLQARLIFYMAEEGTQIKTLWEETFDKEIKNIATALTKIQVAIWKELQALPQPITNSALAGYREYCKLFKLIEKRLDAKDAKPEHKAAFAQCMAQHAQIKGIGGIVSATFDQGLNNLGNSCWMNSAIQAFRKSPYLLVKVRLEPKPKTGETPAEFNDRELMHKALNAVFDAMENGDDVRQTLEDLQNQIRISMHYGVVSRDLAIGVDAQKDVVTFLECLLNVIDYKIVPDKRSVRTEKNADGVEETTDITKPDDNFISCWTIDIHADKTFKELLLLSKSPEDKPGLVGVKLREETRLHELPPVIVTSLKRFAADEEAVKELEEYKGRMSAAFPEWKPDVVTSASEKALEKMRGISMAQITSKITRPILLKADDVLDLSDTYLTESMDKEVRAKARYRLVSVIHHEGVSLFNPLDKDGGSPRQDTNRGHYTAFGIKPDGTWSYMSDSTVRTIEAPKKIQKLQDLNDQDRKKLQELQELNDKVATGYAYVWELILNQADEEGDQKVTAESEYL